MKCSRCDGKKRIFVVDRVVQGQSYGPETEGHYEKCPACGGTGRVLPPKVKPEQKNKK